MIEWCVICPAPAALRTAVGEADPVVHRTRELYQKCLWRKGSVLWARVRSLFTRPRGRGIHAVLSPVPAAWSPRFRSCTPAPCHGFPGFPELWQQTGHLREVPLLLCLPDEECGFPGTKTDLAMFFKMHFTSTTICKANTNEDERGN